jgi:hypothetical protein
MRHAPPSRRFAIVPVVLIAAAAGACAHSAPPRPDPYVDNGVASIRAWMNQLPRCPPAAEKMDGEIERDVGVTAAAIRGLLTLTATPQCTLMACPGESTCCNSCAPRWVVVPDTAGESSREIAIQRSGETQPMSASAKDCKVRPIREQIPKPEVLVSGWLEEEAAGRQKIIRASICVVERTPPKP